MTSGSRQKWKTQHLLKMFALVFFDGVSIIFSYFFALWFRFDCRFDGIQGDYRDYYGKSILAVAVGSILIYYLFKLYKIILRHASYNELMHCILAGIVSIAGYLCCMTFVIHWRMPWSYFMFGGVFQLMLLLLSRFSFRFIALEYSLARRMSGWKNQERAMVIGAGRAGQTIIRELNTSARSNMNVVCIIDDKASVGSILEGVPVVGNRQDILSSVKKYRVEKIIFAIPSAMEEDKRTILNICAETGCKLQTLPGLYQLAEDGQKNTACHVSMSDLKNVNIEDLLGRKAIRVNTDEIFNNISGHVVLVTGGGGSIGSELCRQIAAHKPKRLIIFDVYENNAYDIQMELKGKYGDKLDLDVLIGSVRDLRRLDQVFATHRPEYVFHAAAHKHVPLMEDSPCEAIKNNVIGTYKTAVTAMKYGCRRFVLISTDKAVNPTNVMGASKRMCEMIVQSLNILAHSGRELVLPDLSSHWADEHLTRKITLPASEKPTDFVAVRFGNVLGSHGSVVPLFIRQIENGGPVTVTHPDIIRYFMTIPEAVSLVLQASCYAKGGEIFIFDMGEPVKIVTLAQNVIRLMGKVPKTSREIEKTPLNPKTDVEIVFTGLRPGEKKYEEKLLSEEGNKTTENKLIHIARPVEIDIEGFFDMLVKIAEASYANVEDIRELVQQIVPTYRRPKADIEAEASKKA